MFMDDDDNEEEEEEEEEKDHHHHQCFPNKNHDNTNAGTLNIYCTMFCTTIVSGRQHGFGQWKHISVRQ